MNRSALVRFLDEFLDIDCITDKSLNGLQVEGASEINRISFAVDFCQASAEAACRDDSQMLIVHHGFFWGQTQPITGRRFQQVKTLIQGEVNLYCAHLPLDLHPEVGNNIQLARLLSLGNVKPFGQYQGRSIGIIGDLQAPETANGLARLLERNLGGNTVLLDFGPARIGRVAIVSGDAAMLSDEAADCGADALVTGEVSHTAYHIARERGIHLLCSGHYATETVGLRALAELLEGRFGLETRWIDLPTGV